MSESTDRGTPPDDDPHARVTPSNVVSVAALWRKTLPELGPVARSAEEAQRQACASLLAGQRDDGHWCEELAGDSVLQSEFVLLMFFLGRGDTPEVHKAAAAIREDQASHGGWALYHGGPPDVSSSVKAYFALKLVGDDPDAPWMAEARSAIRGLGGVEETNSYTKIYLALFGQYSWDECPAIPPELVLAPRWFPFTVNDMSSWSRGIFIPLSIIWASRPSRCGPKQANIRELFLPTEVAPRRRKHHRRGWRSVFRAADRAIKTVERSGILPLRQRALDAAERWMVERFDRSDGLGAIFPAIVNATMALVCRGYAADHPLVRGQLDALRRHFVERERTLRVQPSMSPVWDTAQVANTLLVAGVPRDHPALERAASWLVDREVRVAGDWRFGLPRGQTVEPSGWCFQYANAFNPDCDDTAEVLMALRHVRVQDPGLSIRIEGACRRGRAWLLAMQNGDGGWGAFDRGCSKQPLAHVPFGDHNAMLDPSWEDVTGRILEALLLGGLDRSHRAVARAVGFLKRQQAEDGTWFGRWGCNYLYGTWLALRGLRRAGEDMGQERYQRAARWIRAQQNADGGWGESMASYDDPGQKGVGSSTAAQTAWALLALFASGDHDSIAVQRGVVHLCSSQRDGRWHDEAWTGTGFPRVFYLRYHGYDDYFPLLALASYRRGLSGE